MKLQDIINAGGATIAVTGEEYKGSGYAVAQRTFRTYPVSELDDHSLKAALNNSFRQLTPGRYLGLWIDQGKLYIEETVILKTLTYARQAAKLLDQRYIYCFTLKEAIEV